MNDVTTETQVPKRFDPEAFAMNLARAMESSGQALAAYLKPRENGETRDKPPSELNEVIKTFSTVAEYWLSDNARSADLQMKMGKAYLDLWGSAMRRMAGEPADPLHPRLRRPRRQPPPPGCGFAPGNRCLRLGECLLARRCRRRWLELQPAGEVGRRRRRGHLPEPAAGWCRWRRVELQPAGQVR